MSLLEGAVSMAEVRVPDIRGVLVKVSFGAEIIIKNNNINKYYTEQFRQKGATLIKSSC